MQPLTFHPVVGDIGAQVLQLGISSIEAGRLASVSVSELAPAGADEISARAIAAFHAEAAAMLDLNRAAQQELMRAGAAFTQIAQTYTEVDQTAANSVVFAAVPCAAVLFSSD